MGVDSNDQQRFLNFYFYFFLEESNFCTLVRTVFVLCAIPSPGDFGVLTPWKSRWGWNHSEGLRFELFFCYCKIEKRKTNNNKKSTISNPLMFGYSKSAITLFLFSFTVLGKICVQAFLSLGSAEESSRGFHALLTVVSSLWWCFFISFSSPRMSVIRSYWSYRDSNVTNLAGEALQLELLCNLGVSEFEAVQFGMNSVFHFAMNTLDCREEFSCMWGFPNKLRFVCVFFKLLLFFNWNLSEFAQI